MTLVIGGGDLERLIDMAQLISAMEDAQVSYSLGRTISPMRTTLSLPRYPGSLRLMPAYLEDADQLGAKLLTRRPDNAVRGLPIIQATVLLFDPSTGRLLAVLEGSALTAARTAALCGVATKYLAREDAHSLAILGTGRQARTHLWSMLSVRPIDSVIAFDVNPQASTSFQKEMEDRFRLPVRVAGSAEEAAREADILVLTTTSDRPVVADGWLSPGLHVNSIAAFRPDARELETTTIVRSKLVVDSREAALSEAGDILIPMAEGVLDADHIHAEIGEIAAGRKDGRSGPVELTVFKPMGLAIQDVAAAVLLYEKATERGVGTEVDL